MVLQDDPNLTYLGKLKTRRSTDPLIFTDWALVNICEQ